MSIGNVNVGNVMGAGASAWDDVRLLLQVASKPDAIIDELQDLIAKAKTAQVAANADHQKAIVAQTSASTMYAAAKSAQDALVADRKALEEKTIALSVAAAELDARGIQLSKDITAFAKNKAKDDAEFETAAFALKEAQNAVAKREKIVFDLEVKYSRKLEQLRAITDL